MRVVLDTNLIVRAAGDRPGLGRDLLVLALGPRHTLVLSHSLYAEVEKVLHYPRMRALHGWNDAEIRRFLDLLAVGSEQVTVFGYHIGPLVGLDPTDDMVLLTATAGRADVLGTNNQHFFAPGVVRFAGAHGVRILRDVDLISELRGV
ncbi:MAG TPA: putative toxin-antitoxin system toxin component, PIN family [Pirellulales bacterium]|jgi:putative PIN family toxin of toxin-antitoxin system|nr:putative toxin-antitoxin system toxin component, PIN family [Pirellulales bacterium]